MPAITGRYEVMCDTWTWWSIEATTQPSLSHAVLGYCSDEPPRL